MLITDTNTIPSSVGPAKSPQGSTGGSTLATHIITYGYDDLYRLTAASVSGDLTASYGYEYDALGNRMAYTAALTNTVVTTYTYDVANRLETAKADDTGIAWYYVYDNNGRRLQQLPGSLTPTEGAVQYSYDQRGQLVQVEIHDGSSFQLQAEKVYDGQGNRLQAVAHANGSTITATYTLDPRSSLPLLVDNGINVTMILYGQVAIGEYAVQAAEWTYYLGDAQLSVRQLVDATRIVIQAQTYGPYGVLLHQVGDGGGLFGYKGGQSAANGLWYFGDGYFDPATGQFLATNGNPLLPLAAAAMVNPGGLLFGPILFIHWRRRKGKKGVHPATFLLLGVLLAAGLSGCNGPEPLITVTPVSTPGESGTPTLLPPPVIVETTPESPDPTDEPDPITPTPIICRTPIPSPTPLATPYPTIPPTTPAHESYEIVRTILFTGFPEMIESSGKITDKAIVAMVIYGEFHTINYDADTFGEALEALSFQYLTPDQYANGCAGSCDSIDEQIKWLQDIEAWGFVSRNPSGQSMPDHVLGPNHTEWKTLYWNDADRIMQNRYQHGTRMASTVWGNLRTNSPGWNYFNNGGALDWWDIEDGPPFEAYNNDYPNELGVFVVMTSAQNIACKGRPGGSCSGF